jgi:hypothetical protein
MVEPNTLTTREYSLLVGSLLGDGYVEHNGNGYRLQILHSLRQRKYLQWKYAELKRWTASAPKVRSHVDHRYRKSHLSIRFRTRNADAFQALHERWYSGRKKIVPGNIVNMLDPFALAIWYMDDGGRRKDCRGMFLNTLSFTDDEQALLQYALNKRYGIETRLHFVTDGYRIYIPSSMSARLTKLIAPLMDQSMYYKLPYDPVTTEPVPLERARRKVPDNREKNFRHTSVPFV